MPVIIRFPVGQTGVYNMMRNDILEGIAVAGILGLGMVVWYLTACTLFVLLGN